MDWEKENINDNTEITLMIKVIAITKRRNHLKFFLPDALMLSKYIKVRHASSRALSVMMGVGVDSSLIETPYVIDTYQ